MRFKTDENMPSEAVQLLRQQGHDVATVFDQSLGGRPDRDIATVCKQEDRILITLDTDFADIRTYRPSEYPGLLVLRLTKQSAPEVVRIILCLLEIFKARNCRGELWIVEPTRIRIRP